MPTRATRSSCSARWPASWAGSRACCRCAPRGVRAGLSWAGRAAAVQRQPGLRQEEGGGIGWPLATGHTWGGPGPACTQRHLALLQPAGLLEHSSPPAGRPRLPSAVVLPGMGRHDRQPEDRRRALRRRGGRHRGARAGSGSGVPGAGSSQGAGGTAMSARRWQRIRAARADSEGRSSAVQRRVARHGRPGAGTALPPARHSGGARAPADVCFWIRHPPRRSAPACCTPSRSVDASRWALPTAAGQPRPAARRPRLHAPLHRERAVGAGGWCMWCLEGPVGGSPAAAVTAPPLRPAACRLLPVARGRAAAVWLTKRRADVGERRRLSNARRSRPRSARQASGPSCRRFRCGAGSAASRAQQRAAACQACSARRSAGSPGLCQTRSGFRASCPSTLPAVATLGGHPRHLRRQ